MTEFDMEEIKIFCKLLDVSMKRLKTINEEQNLAIMEIKRLNGKWEMMSKQDGASLHSALI